MPQNLLTVVAEFTAKPGKEAELRERLTALVEPTRQEEGCVQYDVHVATDQPGQFLFFENWTSRELLDRHLASAHIKTLLAVLDQLVVAPPRIATFTRIA